MPSNFSILYRICVTGAVQRCIVDACLVSFSFLRAHADWVEARFGLCYDPRKRYGVTYILEVVGLRHFTSGSSATIACIGRSHIT